MRAIFADCFYGGRHTSAINQSNHGTQRLRRSNDRIAVRFRRNVAFHELATELGRQFFARLNLQIRQYNLAAVFDNHACGCSAQTGGTARHDKDLVFDIHSYSK